MPVEPETQRQGFWKRFSKSLEAGRQAYVADLKEVFGRPALDAAFWDDLEASLIAADVGVSTTERVVANLRQQAAGAHLRSPAQALSYLKTELGGDLASRTRTLNLDGSPEVLLGEGVSGSDKTQCTGAQGAARSELPRGYENGWQRERRCRAWYRSGVGGPGQAGRHRRGPRRSESIRP